MKKVFLIFLLMPFCLMIAQDNKIPDVKLKDLNNKPASLEQFYSEGPILVNFWGLSCEPCKKEMKHLDVLNKKFADQGFQIVSINIDNTKSMAKVKSYVKSKKFSFTVLSDPKSALFRKSGGKVMPFTVLIDSDGNIVKRRMGYNPGDEIDIEKDVVELISEHNAKLNSETEKTK